MTKEQDDFITMFWYVIDSAVNTYNQHKVGMVCSRGGGIKEGKGDSWQDMSIDELRSLVCKEYFEFTATKDNTNDECHELIDLILVSMMMCEKLINEGRYVE